MMNVIKVRSIDVNGSWVHIEPIESDASIVLPLSNVKKIEYKRSSSIEDYKEDPYEEVPEEYDYVGVYTLDNEVYVYKKDESKGYVDITDIVY